MQKAPFAEWDLVHETQKPPFTDLVHETQSANRLFLWDYHLAKHYWGIERLRKEWAHAAPLIWIKNMSLTSFVFSVLVIIPDLWSQSQILWSSLPGMLTFLRLRLIRVHLKLGKSNHGILSRSNCWQSDVFNWAPATPLLSFSDLACGGGDRYENLVTRQPTFWVMS